MSNANGRDPARRRAADIDAYPIPFMGASACDSASNDNTARSSATRRSKATHRTRTGDLSFTKAPLEIASAESTDTYEGQSANVANRDANRFGNPTPDADLQAVADAWDGLPQHVRATILTLIETTGGRP